MKVYRQYLKGCPQSKDSLLQGESYAKQQRLAFWSQSNPVMPWDFRHRATQKTTSQAIQPQQQNNCDPAYPDFCIPKNSPDLNCRDVTQRRFRVLPPDPHGFDRDGTGLGVNGKGIKMMKLIKKFLAGCFLLFGIPFSFAMICEIINPKTASLDKQNAVAALTILTIPSTVMGGWLSWSLVQQKKREQTLLIESEQKAD